MAMLPPEVDPLADSVPPRHAYESDDEDEIPGASSQTKEPINVPENVKVQIDGDLNQAVGKPLFVVSGKAGSAWIRGVRLGEQLGRVAVEGVQTGLVFSPTWLDGATLLVSEVTAKLPLWAMHPYALQIILQLRPKSVVVLDSYPVPTYISSNPLPYHESPVRFLFTGSSPTGSSITERFPAIKPFAPPNLLQATSACFLSILALPFAIPNLRTSLPPQSTTQSQRPHGTLLLLPSRHAAPLVPPRLQHSSVETGSDPLLEETTVGLAAGEEWGSSMMQLVLDAATSELGVKVNSIKWGENLKNDRSNAIKTTRRSGGMSEVGEGGMYI